MINFQRSFGRFIHGNALKAGYHEKVVKYFENPPNVGSLKKSKKNVGTGKPPINSGVVGSMACGDQLKFQIEVDDAGVVREAVFKTFGCGSAIASSSYATELVKGKHIDEIAGIKNSGNNFNNPDISGFLNLPPVKLHCSMLAEDAIKMALQDYKQKNPEKAAQAGLDEETSASNGGAHTSNAPLNTRASH